MRSIVIVAVALLLFPVVGLAQDTGSIVPPSGYWEAHYLDSVVVAEGSGGAGCVASLPPENVTSLVEIQVSADAQELFIRQDAPIAQHFLTQVEPLHYRAEQPDDDWIYAQNITVVSAEELTRTAEIIQPNGCITAEVWTLRYQGDPLTVPHGVLYGKIWALFATAITGDCASTSLSYFEVGARAESPQSFLFFSITRTGELAYKHALLPITGDTYDGQHDGVQLHLVIDEPHAQFSVTLSEGACTVEVEGTAIADAIIERLMSAPQESPADASIIPLSGTWSLEITQVDAPDVLLAECTLPQLGQGANLLTYEISEDGRVISQVTPSGSTFPLARRLPNSNGYYFPASFGMSNWYSFFAVSPTEIRRLFQSSTCGTVTEATLRHVP